MIEDPKKTELDRRSEAASAFQLERPAAAKPPAFERFEISPEQGRDLERSRDTFEDSLESRFTPPRP